MIQRHADRNRWNEMACFDGCRHMAVRRNSSAGRRKQQEESAIVESCHWRATELANANLRLAAKAVLPYGSDLQNSRSLAGESHNVYEYLKKRQ
jgi:hypothetical protein